MYGTSSSCVPLSEKTGGETINLKQFLMTLTVVHSWVGLHSTLTVIHALDGGGLMFLSQVQICTPSASPDEEKRLIKAVISSEQQFSLC